MADYGDVCVLIPTLNEAETIGSVIDGLHEQGLENVLVIDGHSTDGTSDIARERGARVIEQTGTGKGQAVREALEHVASPYVLMLDGDGTYRPSDADRLLEPLLSGDAAHVIGNRFADIEEGAMSRVNRVGNRIVNTVFRLIHGQGLQDILSGYRAFTLESTRRFTLSSEGFGIETEFAVECVKFGIPTTVVPIRYCARPAESETNLNPVRDGAVIFLTLYRLAKTNNPLFYFGSVGITTTLLGVLLGVFVAIEWLVRGISHEVLAVVGTLAILLGVQLLLFGILSDMIVTLNREQTRRLEMVTRQFAEADRPDRYSKPAERSPADTERVDRDAGSPED